MKEIGNNINTVSQISGELELARMDRNKAEGEQGVYLNLLVELEDKRRAKANGEKNS